MVPQAADKGFAEAQYTLGNFYEDGTGVMQDYAEAMRWYRLAAAQGHRGRAEQYRPLLRRRAGRAEGQCQNADVVQRSPFPGFGAKRRANALTFRDEFASGMTRQQIAQAEALAMRCRDSGFMACD